MSLRTEVLTKRSDSYVASQEYNVNFTNVKIDWVGDVENVLVIFAASPSSPYIRTVKEIR